MFPLHDYSTGCRTMSTQRACRAAISDYIEFIFMINHDGSKTVKRTREEVSHLNDLSIQYLEEERDHASDLVRYVSSRSYLSPTSIRSKVSIIRSWLESNDILISPGKNKMLKNRLPRRKVLTQDKDVSRDDIIHLSHYMSLQGRAIILVLMTSGMRIGELLQITLDDIDLESKPAEIFIQEEYTKIKKERYTFISSEAVEIVKSWLQSREKWMRTAKNRGRGIGKEKSMQDNRLFPFGVMTVNRMFVTALRRADMLEIDERTGRSTISPHSFRKYFLSQAKLGMPIEMAELLAGHTGYLTDAYRRYPKEQVKEAYLRGEYVLSLSSPVDIKKMRSQEEQISAMASENIRLKMAMPTMIQQEVERQLQQKQDFKDLYEDKRDIGL